MEKQRAQEENHRGKSAEKEKKHAQDQGKEKDTPRKLHENFNKKKQPTSRGNRGNKEKTIAWETYDRR